MWAEHTEHYHSSFHFAYGGHVENMQIMIIYVFGYIDLRFIFNGKNVRGHFKFRYSNLGGFGPLE